ncbi:uncharacterized protein BCN122_II0109 [Burkholderia cenocepacia]|nr:uncharacterized protein BCN122_II0109 [Burkholderia cenocepacia]
MRRAPRGSRTSGLDGACPFETAGDGVLVRREEVLGIGVRMVSVFEYTFEHQN